MPRKLPESKPTKQETKIAVEMQAPPKRGSRSSEPIAPKLRTLADAGIDGERCGYLKIAQLFADDKSDISEPFCMTSARLKPNKFEAGKFLIDFGIVVIEDGEPKSYLISLSQDDSREEYVAYFATNTVPLGWLEFHKIEPSKPGFRAYYAIHQAGVDNTPDLDIPF